MYLKQCLVTSNVEFFKGNVGDIIKAHKTIKQYAYILHDKDEGQSPHWTIYLNFGSSGVDTKQVGEWFGLQESQVEKIKGRKTDALQYLTHSNDTQRYKYQYPSTDITANFDFQTEIDNSKILGDFKNFSYAEQLEYIETLPVSEKPAAYRKLETLWKIRCQWLTLHTERKIDVMFICGKGGTGKTYYAKKLLKSMDYDYCLSSSSNDMMQDYLGQKAMILDDCRDRSFKSFEDCLKMLDNHTSSTVQSRFHNKSFNGEMIVITSSVPLRYWFRGKNADGNFFNVSNEDFIQLYRRIGSYVEITNEEIYVYSEIDKYGNPTGTAQCFVNELREIKKETVAKTDFASLFGKICEPSTTNVFDIQQLSIEGTQKKTTGKTV